jgi:SAM-dependent methyltransferase
VAVRFLPSSAWGKDYYGPLAETYAAYRPRPPTSFVELLCSVARDDRPRLVVDLGSGTGLSTTIWADHAEQVVGIEPDARMRALAEADALLNVRYVDAVAESTGLPDSSADIVTACCSLHWMTPRPFAEIARILRPGGVFATSDVVGRSIHPKVDPALDAFEEHYGALEHLREQLAGRGDRIRASGFFRHVSEVTLTSKEEGDADRVVGLLLSQGRVARRIASGEWTERGLGLNKLRRKAKRALGDRTVPFIFTYFVCMAIRSDD